MTNLLMHPTATAAAAPQLNAELLFRRHRHQGGPVELWPLTVDGTDYLTDKVILIRRDRLQGVTSAWAWIGQAALPHARLRALADALREGMSPGVPFLRFPAELVSALYLCGAGIRPLLGDVFGDVHAVVVGAERVGLAMPLRNALPEAMLGVVPGVPPGPAGDDLDGNEWL